MKERKNNTSKGIDILQGRLLKNIILFAIPLAVSSILQQLFNAIDVAVIGRFATSQDQAAVGCNGAVINLLINLFVGISIGTNVVISNYIGQGEEEKVKKAVHTSILLAAISGVMLTVLGLAIARPVLIMMDTPADTLVLAIRYLRIYFLGMPFIMIYNFGAAILRSTGDTKRPLYCLVVCGLLNAALNMIFVIVFSMGVAGVAIGTVVSNILGTVIILYILAHEKGPIQLSFSQLRIGKTECQKILRIGVPAGIQGMVFSLANVFVQKAINSFGSEAVAGSAVALNYEYMTYFIISAFAQTTVTFVSQNYGANNYDRCKKVYRICMICSVLITGTMSFLILSNGSFCASLFTSDPLVIKYALIRMKYILTWNFVASSYEIAGASLRGIGYSSTPAVMTIFGSCILRLIWIYTIFAYIRTYDMLLIVYPVSWILTGIGVLIAYYIITRKRFVPAEIR